MNLHKIVDIFVICALFYPYLFISLYIGPTEFVYTNFITELFYNFNKKSVNWYL